MTLFLMHTYQCNLVNFSCKVLECLVKQQYVMSDASLTHSEVFLSNLAGGEASLSVTLL